MKTARRVPEAGYANGHSGLSSPGRYLESHNREQDQRATISPTKGLATLILEFGKSTRTGQAGPSIQLTREHESIYLDKPQRPGMDQTSLHTCVSRSVYRAWASTDEMVYGRVEPMSRVIAALGMIVGPTLDMIVGPIAEKGNNSNCWGTNTVTTAQQNANNNCYYGSKVQARPVGCTHPSNYLNKIRMNYWLMPTAIEGERKSFWDNDSRKGGSRQPKRCRASGRQPPELEFYGPPNELKRNEAAIDLFAAPTH
ncbi:hypothetical protein WN55_07962 [Dufourea novaeangliae]|uniref:Uncharacterized protein n=1 Tax=Dufourea novaeangliae TaxID=178035 RepID=A0A154P6U1_DUFNO|nr:hypothetical protein WN55_07962 [Dufourea novaeangliae]